MLVSVIYHTIENLGGRKLGQIGTQSMLGRGNMTIYTEGNQGKTKGC